MNIGDMGVPFIYQGEELIYPEYVKDGLVLHYDFSGMTNEDETKGIARDLSGNGNHGTLQNFNFTPESGYDKNKLLFDGVDDGVFTRTAESYQSEYSTYEAVLDFRRSGQAYQSIFQRYSFWADGLFFSGRQIRAYLALSSGGVSQMVDVPQDTVFHIVRTVDLSKGTQNIYLNGALINSRTDLSGTLDERVNTSNLIVSQQANPLSSIVYSLKVYNRPLTPEEIAHNYAIEKERFIISKEIVEEPKLNSLPISQAVIGKTLKVGGDK